MLGHFDISAETLFGILGETILLPKMGKKKDFNERLPSSLNFGLGFISITPDWSGKPSIKLVPKYVRCNFDFENTKHPPAIFEGIEVSQSGMKVLEWYVGEFSWLVELMEDCKNGRIRKEFKAGLIFPKDGDPNIRLYREFIKLYQQDTAGDYHSIYSKISQADLPKFHSQIQRDKPLISLPYRHIISRRQASVAPPSFRMEPEYHNVGNRVVLLRRLEVGFVVGIDDHWLRVAVGKEQRLERVRFEEAFSEGWDFYLSSEPGRCWDYQPSYYAPTYWRKVTQRSDGA